MERFPRKIQDKDLNSALDHISQNAMGNIILLTATPTSASEMKANTMAYYNNELFIKLGNGELKKFTVTAV